MSLKLSGDDSAKSASSAATSTNNSPYGSSSYNSGSYGSSNQASFENSLYDEPLVQKTVKTPPKQTFSADRETIFSFIMWGCWGVELICFLIIATSPVAFIDSVGFAALRSFMSLVELALLGVYITDFVFICKDQGFDLWGLLMLILIRVAYPFRRNYLTQQTNIPYIIYLVGVFACIFGAVVHIIASV